MDDFIDATFARFAGRMQEFREAKRGAAPLFSATSLVLELVHESDPDHETLQERSSSVHSQRPALRLVGGRPSQS
ncbi:hypothetical protein D3C71_2134210 [compost metagenome]